MATAGTALSQQSTQPAPTTTSWAPTAKVSAGILASAVTILIVQFVPHANTWTPAAAGAITQIVTFVVQYMVPERK
jgi:membrane protein YdbS with pleckstrin-like domain